MDIDTTDTVDNNEDQQDTDKNIVTQTVMNLESHVTTVTPPCSSAWWEHYYFTIHSYKIFYHTNYFIFHDHIFIYLLPENNSQWSYFYCSSNTVSTCNTIPDGVFVAQLLLCSFCYDYVNVILYLGKWQQKIDALVPTFTWMPTFIRQLMPK